MLHPCRFQTLFVPSALDGYNGCRVNVNIIFFNLVAELTVVLRHHKQCGAACDLIARLYLAFPFVAVNGHVTVAVVNHYPVAVYLIFFYCRNNALAGSYNRTSLRSRKLYHRVSVRNNGHGGGTGQRIVRGDTLLCNLGLQLRNLLCLLLYGNA